MDQQREVLIWFINFQHWAKVNDYTDPQLHGKDPLVCLLWLASTLLLAKVVSKQYTDLVARGLRSRCTVNAPCLTAISALLTRKMRVSGWIICLGTGCRGIFSHVRVAFPPDTCLATAGILLPMLHGKGHAVAHRSLEKLSVFCWEIESISINGSHGSNGSRVSTLHFA